MKTNLLFAAALLAVLPCKQAFAQYRYTYTGNNYDFFYSEGPNPNPYNATEQLTFSFETDALYTNGKIPLSSIGAWSQSDGLSTIGGAGLATFSNLSMTYFQTDSNGSITDWFFDYGHSEHGFVSESQPNSMSVGHPAPYAGDSVQQQQQAPDFFEAGSDSIGAWNVIAVPEPSVFPMLGVGLVLLLVKQRGSRVRGARAVGAK